MHDPIEQQAVLLRDAEAPRAFLAFLRGPAGRAVLERYGYLVPAAPAAPAPLRREP
jgi:molybdate transport system substrate-binding protein